VMSMRAAMKKRKFGYRKAMRVVGANSQVGTKTLDSHPIF